MRRKRRTFLLAGLLCLAAAGSAEAASFKAQTASFRAVAAQAQAQRAAMKKAAKKVRKYPYASRTLRMGMTGGDVVKLQKYLNGLALPTTVDGAYGATTKKSVVAFERERTMKVDGAVQPKQARKIRQAAKKRRVTSSGHIFPVRGPHSFGGPSSAFGADRGDHIHQGHDVTAACDTPLVSAGAGTLRVNNYQASGAGNYVVIHDTATTEDYVYMHMTARSAILPGTAVFAGQPIGTVGATGSAEGCHLHFEIWTAPGWYLGGAPYDPLPTLLAWDAVS